MYSMADLPDCEDCAFVRADTPVGWQLVPCAAHANEGVVIALTEAMKKEGL